MSTISASTTSTTAYKVTADTTGTLVFQTGASPTTAMTLGSDQSVTFAGTPTYSGGTANGVAYLNGSKALTTGSALVFNGTNLGIGGSPSAWNSANKVLQLSYAATVAGGTTLDLYCNAYVDSGGTVKYIDSFAYASKYAQYNGQHLWYTTSSTQGAGNTITGFSTAAMTFTRDGWLAIGNTSPRVSLDVSGQVFANNVLSVTAGDGGATSAAKTQNVYYGWAAASARTGWGIASASGGNQYASYYCGTNNIYLTWNILANQCTSLTISIVYVNNADGTSRTANADYSYDGGSTWTSFGPITFGASGGSELATTLTFASNYGRNVQVRTYWTNNGGGSASNLIGIGRVTFTANGGNIQFVGALG